MECPNGCAPPLEERKIEKLLHRRQQPIVVKDLTVYLCLECGHQSLPLASARFVEDILNGKASAAGQFTAELYQAS